jgi:hypothetical protein
VLRVKVQKLIDTDLIRSFLDFSRSYHEEKNKENNGEGIRTMKRKENMGKEKGWKNNMRKTKKQKFHRSLKDATSGGAPALLFRESRRIAERRNFNRTACLAFSRKSTNR